MQRFREGLGTPNSSRTAWDRQFEKSSGDRPEMEGLVETAWAYPDSTRVKAYQYDYGNQQLRVRFIKYGTPWVYNLVPVTVFQAFDAAPSKGKYINSTLNHMEHHRASPQEVAAYFDGI